MLSVDELPPLVDLLPHDPPMVLLDAISAFGEIDIECTVTVAEGAPFVRDGKVAAVVALEYMAQASGVFLGIMAFSESGRIKRGYLLGAREMELDADYFHVGDTLRVFSKHVWGKEDMASFDCLVTRNDRRVAWATLNILIADEDGASKR
jgi:predicted hotdog family 3-hydroxylacyl-ACP dehydratase